MSKQRLFKGIEHVGIGAVDTTALAQWYCEVFSLDIVFKSDDAVPIYFLSMEHITFKIEIFPVQQLPDMSDHSVHVCFEVSSLDDAIVYLNSKNITCGEIKMLMKNGKTVFFKDPLGHILQVVERPEILWND